MLIIVIGKTGLAGSAICRRLEAQQIPFIGINRENYAEHRGAAADIVINANGSGKKGWANAHPAEDFDLNVTSTRNYLFDFSYRFFVHISSIDVYPDAGVTAATREDAAIDPMRLAPYGFHKFLSEQLVRRYAPRWMILRLGGLVGPGLDKNPVYDWSHGRPLFISAESRLNFIHTDEVARITMELIGRERHQEVYNICGRDSIRLRDLSAVRDLPVREQESGEPLVIQDYAISTEKVSGETALQSTAEYIRQYLDQDLPAETTEVRQ